MDLVGPYPRTKRGKQYILTIIDAYTRHLTSVALADKTATSVSRGLVEEVYLKLGCPRSLLSDLGTEFKNQVLEGICKLMGIQKLRTTVHRPSANGRCERSHRSISSCLAKMVSDNQRDWDEHLPMVTFAINCAKNEATMYSPFELLFGRLPRMPVEMVIDLPSEVYARDLDQYVEEFAERIRQANILVQKHGRSTFGRMKKNYDARVHETTFTVGQFVLYYYPRRYKGRSPKLSRPNIGPFRVLQRINSVNYIIALTPKSRRIIVHIDKLKPWTGEEPKCWQGVEIPDTDLVNASPDETSAPAEVITTDLSELFDNQSSKDFDACVKPGADASQTKETSTLKSKPKKSRIPTRTFSKESGYTADEPVIDDSILEGIGPQSRPRRIIRRPVRYRN